ncbi:MAG TPA: YidB family protein [Caulobacteraceae bacterium]|nr:YidB family protein [Caulobacteraceae bacterium]
MSLLDGIIGGAMASVVNNLIQEHGGVSGIVSQLRSQGLGETVHSWVSTGPNQPVSPDALNQALGSQSVANLAAQYGMTPEELSAKLAQVLPQAVDHMTPTGQVPPA